jgi:hypothetical protein
MAMLSLTAEDLAKKFHDEYERLAPLHGYRTRLSTAKPWSDVPDNNKRLMIATARGVLKWLREKGIEI